MAGEDGERGSLFFLPGTPCGLGQSIRLAVAHRHGHMQEAICRVIRLAIADEHNTPKVGARKETQNNAATASLSRSCLKRRHWEGCGTLSY